MTFLKFTILIVFISYVFILPDSPGQRNKIPLTRKSYSSDIDSLKKMIKIRGWDNNLLEQYRRYLTNSEISIAEEISGLKNFPYSFERTFLISLVYKRQKKFKKMYDSLYAPVKSYIQQHSDAKIAINYLPYYEELVFAASALDLLSFLQSKIPALKKQNPFYADYLSALIFYSQGKYKNSLDLLKDAFPEYSSDFSFTYRLSYIYRNLGNYDEALKILIGCLKNIPDIDDWDRAKILLAEGSLYFLSGKNADALKLYKEGYTLSQRIGDLEEESRALVNLGIIEDVSGDINNSRTNFFSAIEIAKKINDIDAEALAHSELGVSYSYTNELIKAKEYYEKSYGLYTATGNQLRLSLLSNNLGTVYSQMFDYESALKYFQTGIEYAGENKRAVIKNLIGMADIYTNLSNYSKAIQLYKKAHEISKEIKEVALDAEINYGLGALNFGLNKYKDALDEFKKSYELNNQSDAFFSSQILNQMAVVYTHMDSLKNAKTCFYDAIVLSRKNSDSYSEISSCIDLASLYIKENGLKDAERTLNMAKSDLRNIKSAYLESQIYLIAGKIFKAKKMFHDAQEAFTKSLNLAVKLKEFDTQIETNYLLAELFEDNNLNEGAESYYKSAINLTEDVSRSLFGNDRLQISYYSSKEEIYNSFADFYLKQGKFASAFGLIDKSRSRNTMHNLVNLKLQSLIKNDSLLKKIYDYEWILHSDIYSENEVNRTKTSFELLKEKLIKTEPAVEKFLSTGGNLTLKQMQDKLRAKVNLLSIYTTPANTYLFLVNKDNFYHFKINLSSKELREMVRDISPYFNYSNSSAGSFYNQDLFAFNAKAAYSLFERLLKPAFDKINQGEKIIISSSPELLTLPFEFLISRYNNAGSEYDYKNKDFLVLNYDISYTPSIAVFFEQHKSSTSDNEKVLLVGNPLINNKISGYAERRGLLEEQSSLPREIPLLPLRYSGEEVNDIGKIIKASIILTDKNATETNFKKDADQSGIIHLSTHSFLFNKQPVIFFSNYYDPDNDGFLEAGEIVQLKLKSDLVVLSSCNSGLGVIDESEGILGMTKAFFEAGAKSVVVSLWTVNDKYTAKFMTLFYENLSKGFDKSEALRQAKIEFIKKYSPNPYYWAAFVLSGNVSKLNLKTPVNVIPYIIEIVFIILILSAIIYFRKRSKRKIYFSQ